MQFTLKFLKKLPLYDEVQSYKLHDFSNFSEAQQTNCVYEIIDEVIAQDIRVIQESLKLGREGFEIISVSTRYAISAEIFENDNVGANSILANYFQETMDLVNSKLNADSIVTIHLRVGNSSSE